MTVPHQSYYELKKDTSEDFARRALLYNLERLKNNVRACTREMRCSPNAVYLALKKQIEGNLKDASHRPKRKHPRHISDEKEQMIIDYRKKTNYGKRRLQYHIHSEKRIRIPESTIGKVIKRNNLERKKKKRVKRAHHSPKYNMEALFPFQELQVDLKEIIDKKTLPKKVYNYLKTSDLPIYQWTVIDVLTRIRFICFSYRKDWFCGKAFCQYVLLVDKSIRFLWTHSYANRWRS